MSRDFAQSSSSQDPSELSESLESEAEAGAGAESFSILPSGFLKKKKNVI